MAGIVFTGGYRPRSRELEAIRQAGMFAYFVPQDTYAAASQIHDLLVKTHPADRDKIAEIRALVAGSFDVDGLLERLDTLRLRGDEGTGAHQPRPGASSQGVPVRGFLDRLRRLAG
jgi:hypothetical protein